MREPKALYEFVIHGPARPVPYRVLCHPMGQREVQWFDAGNGEWVTASTPIADLTDEILRLRGILEEVEQKGQVPGSREQPVSVMLDRGLWDRIRQALRWEEEKS